MADTTQHTKPWAIAIVILCTVFTSVGALFLKKGVDLFGGMTPEGILAAYPVLIGLILYFLGFVLLTVAFKHGELSALFPFVSLSFVWVAILSLVLLGEIVGIFEILGVAAIVSGVVLIGIASRNGNRKNARLRLRS
jgi:drug/metabolite transporter (DMT)-like permease